MATEPNATEKRVFKGVWISAKIFDSRELTPFDKILLAEVDSLDPGSGCFASNEYLAKKMGTTSGYIANRMSKLRKDGWIRDIGFDGRRRFIGITHSTSQGSHQSEGRVVPEVNIDSSEGTSSGELCPDGQVKLDSEPKPESLREPNQGQTQPPQSAHPPPSRYTPDFEAVFKLYPRRQSKGQAYTTWKKWNKQGVTNETIAECIERYKRTVWKRYRERNPQYEEPLMSSWLNKCPWDDMDEPKSQPSPVGTMDEFLKSLGIG